MGEPLTEIEIPCPDMPADGAARYRVMVAETQRMTREVAAMAEKLREAEADKARLAEDAVKLSTLLQEATARAEKAEAASREAMEAAAVIASTAAAEHEADKSESPHGSIEWCAAAEAASAARTIAARIRSATKPEAQSGG